MNELMNDEKDAARFRFWCWMIANHPSLIALKIVQCIDIEDYRNALDELMVDFKSNSTLQ